MLIRNSLFTLGLAVLAVAPACPPPIKFPIAIFSPRTLTFSPQLAVSGAAASAAQTVTLTNSGSGTLQINSIDASGTFSQTNDCGASLASKAACSVQVTFAPNMIGTVNGAITLNSNSIGSPIVVSLSGTGVAPVGFSPLSLDFGSVSVNTTSAAQTITLTNNQNGALAIKSVGTTGDYSQTNNCSASLGAGQTCQISVKFKPTVSGTIAGALNVNTDATPDAEPIALTGVGTGSVSSNVSFSAASLSFGNQEAGSVSSQKSVSVKNNGNTSLTIQTVTASFGYASTDNCAGQMLAPGSTCTVNVKFQPQTDFVPVSYPGSVTIVDSDGTSPQVIGLTGTGVAPITSAPATLDFGKVLADTTSAPQTFTLTNNDASGQTLTVTPSGGFVLGNNTCSGSTLAAGSKCHVDTAVSTHSTGGKAGTLNGALTITASSSGFLNPEVVNLQACVTQLVMTPPTFNFGAVPVGSSSTTETVTLSSPNGSQLTASGATVTGPNAADFALSNDTCTGGPFPSCTVDVTYTPQASGVRNAAVSIADDDGCSPHQQSLTGGSSAGPFTIYVNVTANSVGGGSNSGGEIVSSPAGIDCTNNTGTCSATFPSGTSVTLAAAPDTSQPGTHISAWSGGCSGSSSCVLDMTSDHEVTGNFTPDPQTIVMLTGTGNGTVKSNPAAIDCESPLTPTTVCTATFPPGSSVTLTATVPSGSDFTGWSGGACTGNGNTCTFTSTGDQTVSANFVSLNAPDFSLSATQLNPATISAGQSATSTLSIAAVNGFNSAVTLTCSSQTATTGMPVCNINPSSASPGDTATLTVSTIAHTAAHNSVALQILLATWLPFVAGAIVIGSRRKGLLPASRLALLLLGTIVLSLTLQSCGGASTTGGGGGGTPPGNYTIRVTGASGATQHSTTVTLSVQ